MDCEYANRYVAFTELDIHEYKGNIEESFVRVMTYCTKTFGKYAFRKLIKTGEENRLIRHFLKAGVWFYQILQMRN